MYCTCTCTQRYMEQVFWYESVDRHVHQYQRRYSSIVQYVLLTLPTQTQNPRILAVL
ncbi:hypothetical protein BD777DRAFT_128819 [Yarrowia lipolytica]|nr:hypothetical protein BD777DRAFT_128819 [Yarrowia lipolytica]